MKNFTSNVDDDDILLSRDNRNSTINRPDIDPGMEDDDDDFSGWGSFDKEDNDWGSSFNRGPGGFNDPMRSSMDGGFSRGLGGFSAQYGDPMGQQKQQTNENPEDKFFNGVVVATKGSYNFLVQFIESFKTFDSRKRILFSRNLIKTGIGLLVLGLITGLLLKFEFISIALSGLLTLLFGVPFFLLSIDKREEEMKNESLYNDEEYLNDDDNSEDDFSNFVSSEEIEHIPDDDSEDDEIDLFGKDESENISDESDIWGFTVNEEPKLNIESSKGFDYEPTIEKPENTDDIIESLDTNNGMMTRQYIFERVMDSLESVKKDFASSVKFDEDSREFLAFCSMVEKAANAISGGEKETPIVKSVEDKLFYTLIIIEKSAWMKGANLKTFVDELEHICAFDKEKCEINPEVTSDYFTVGNEVYIKMMKGESAMVTIKDAYLNCKDKILDMKNKMPVVLGIDSEGSIVFTDFDDVNSFLISGAPRTGKSWCVKSLVSQLMMFAKPSEMQFYFIDAKSLTSDYYTLETPHIRGFEYEDDKIIKLLSHFVNEESKRREKILYDTGKFKNIKDFKKVNPDIELPYVYIIIDEILTISKRMDKEMVKEFQSLLLQFTTRLPNLGLRLIIVPHLVKNDVVGKSITDMMPNRACVRGDADDLDKIFGIKEREFPYKLVHKGDMAVQFEGEKPGFVHSVIVSSTNQGYDEFFNFLTNFWLKIEPESFKGSKLEKDIRNGDREKNEFIVLNDMDLSYLEAPLKKINSNIEDDDFDFMSSNDSEPIVEEVPVRRGRGRPRKNK